MFFLCVNNISLENDTSIIGNFDDGKWKNITLAHFECHIDLLNATISSCFAYVILLMLIYLRCSRLHRQLMNNNNYLFTTHYLRGFFTALLFLIHLCELGDSLLSNSSKPDILVSSSALILWLGEFMLHNRIERARRPRYLIFCTILWILMAISRLLRLLVVLSIAKERNIINFEKWLRLYTTSAAIIVITIIIVINIYTIYVELCTKIYIIRDPIAHFITYQHGYVNVFSKATFSWLTPLLWAGYREPLELNDFGLLPDEESTSVQFHLFKKIYLHEKENSNTKNVSLWKCYFKFCWKKFLLGGIFKFLGDCMTLVGPLGISIIIAHVANKDRINHLIDNRYISYEDFFYNGYIIGILVFIAAILQGTLSQSSTHLVNVEGIHLKIALQALIYDKTLKVYSLNINQENKDNCSKTHEKLDKTKLKDVDKSADMGKITNLLAEDTFNVMSFFWIGHYTWAIPLKIGVLIYFLHIKLGISAVIGAFICIFTMSPLQFLIGKKMSENSKKISEKSDERLRKINETIQGIKVIKLLAWEKIHEYRIRMIRQKELKYLNNDSIYWALMTFLTHASSILITLVTFGIYYILEEKNLNAQDVFAGLALFNQLTVPLFIFPVTVPIIINAAVSTRRIEEFLSQSEVQAVLPQNNNDFSHTNSNKTYNSSKLFRDLTCNLKNIDEDVEQNETNEPLLNTKQNVLEIINGKFSWHINEHFTLFIPNMTIPKGLLTIIIGKIGSGKTSLVSAMLGEMYQLEGKIKWANGVSIAYVPQKPWLFNGTIRENILFGEPFRPKRYDKILAVCALKPDLELLPGNDLTEVGEKGINLSGGQKQRITIARALYSQANTIILDDPFSALDYRVGQNIFDNGIKKMILRQKRTVILVTHRLQLIYSAQKVIVIEKGTIRAQGSSQQLKTTEPDLMKEWFQIVSSEQNEEEQNRSKTAKERWKLFRLISRIGNHLKNYNSIHGTWTVDEETHVNPQPYRPLKKRPSSIYGSKYSNFAHDLPLPTDECDEDLADDQPLRRTTKAVSISGNSKSSILWNTSHTKFHRMATRAISLQSNPIIKSRPTIIRQLSSPSIQHEPLYSFCTLSSRLNSTEFHSHRLTKAMRYSSEKSISIEKEQELFTRKILPSSSIRNNGLNYDDKNSLQRLKSSSSLGSDDFDNESIMPLDETEHNLINEEERTYGRIPKRIFWSYIKAGGVCASFSYLISALTWQISRVYTDYWLSKWSERGENNTTSNLEYNNFYNKTEYYLLIYAVLSILSVILSFTSNGLGQCCGAVARKNLHVNMLTNILKCPMYFFEITPMGRLINRFSTDMAVIDKKIATSIQRLLQFLFLCFSAILVNAAVTPWFLIIVIPICLIYYIVQKFYRFSSRELQRLDSLARSPVLSHFSETLRGLITIRAYGHQSRFTATMYKKMDSHTNIFLILNTSNRWLGITLDYLGGFILLTAIMACLLTAEFYSDFVTPSLVGLAVNYTLLVPVYLTWVVKFLADMEMYMSAVDRIENYSHMSTENYQTEGIKVKSNWPKNGDILFENVSLKYKNQTEPIICNLNLHIPAGQKIGVCGRTGSGKSSLALSLFAMVDVCEGKIKIDDIDISTVPLQKLRSSISIIPQDVIMFGGTVRDNLDPLNQYTDDQIWRSLEMAQIKNVVNYLGGLDGEIREGGSNLSCGERQLLCLARVILQNSTITIMDEATSSVDPVTERAFLQAAKNAFINSTVITIAHRLEMILDCERIIVLENGQIIEDGSPEDLKNKSNGIFSIMLNSSKNQ